jgi:RNA polymerase sigma factor (sigma-70 family)
LNNDYLKTEDTNFTELYKRNIDTVYRLCYMYLKNSADAEDASQSVFMKLLKSNKIFESLDHEKAWLILAAKNYSKDVLKSWWKSRRINFENIPEIAYWDNSKIANEIFEKLLLLPAKYKEVLYLYYYEGYPVKDISKILELKESTVQTRLFNGRNRLKISIGGCYNEE